MAGLANALSGVPVQLKKQLTIFTDSDNNMFEETINKETGEVTKKFIGKKTITSSQDRRLSKLTPKKFDVEKGFWKNASLLPVANIQEGSPLSFVTYNVWFSPLNWKKRAEGLFNTILQRSPSIICLQEVTPHFLTLLLEQPWVRGKYYISDNSVGTVKPYGVILLSQFPILKATLFDLPTRMSRRFLLAEVLVHADSVSCANNKSILVGTVHLESMDQLAYRKEQLCKIRDAIMETPFSSNKSIFIMGDFNFNFQCEENDFMHETLKNTVPIESTTAVAAAATDDDNASDGAPVPAVPIEAEAEAGTPIPAAFIDCWEACNGYTDLSLCTTRRGLLIDRVLYRPPNDPVPDSTCAASYWYDLTNISRIGKEPCVDSDAEDEGIVEGDANEDKHYPSDHDGIYTVFRPR